MKTRRVDQFAAASFVLSLATAGFAQPVIFNATFDSEPLGPLNVQANTEPLPLHLPTTIIRDTSLDRVDVSAPVGDFTSNVMLLDSTPNNLADAAFFNPVRYTYGIYSISWDSVVTQVPASNFEAIMVAVDNSGGVFGSTFALSYDPSGAFRIGSFQVGNPISGPLVGHFLAGQQQHFQVLLNLDTHSYSFLVDSVLFHQGDLFEGTGFSHTTFDSMGRYQTAADFPPWAVDNLIVEAVPEPSILLSLSTAVAGCMLRPPRGVRRDLKG